MRVEEAEAENRVWMTVGKMEIALREADFSESAQLYARV